MPPTSRRTAVLLSCLAAAVLVAGVLVWWLNRPDPAPAATPSPSVTVTTPAAPATDAPDPTGTTPATDPSAAPVDPVDPAEPAEPQEPPAAQPAAVDVIASYAFWNADTSAVEVGAYAATVESGGRCTLTLTGPGGTATITADAEQDATTTACPGLVLSGAPLSSGTWQAVVSYASAAHAGTSDPIEVVIP